MAISVDERGAKPLIWLAILLVPIAALHVAGWAGFPPDVDPINFVAALAHYDIGGDAPHPPGYPMFVGLGRLAQLLVGPWHAYQLVNLAMLLGAGLLVGRIGAQLGSARGGVIAAVVLVTHPLAWAATVIPECYFSDAFGAAALVSAGLTVGRRRTAGLAGFWAAILFIALCRPTSCVLLLPLGLTAIWLGFRARERRIPPILTALTGALVLIAIAYAVTVWLAGGLAVYRAAADRVMGAAFRGSSVLGGAPLAVHAAMDVRLALWFVLLAIPMSIALAFAARRRRMTDSAPILLLALAWVLPALGFYAVVYYLKPTYQLIYLPALCLLFGWAVARSTERRPRLGYGIAAGLGAAQLAFFWLGGPGLPAQFQRLTHAHFAQMDAAWQAMAATVSPMPPDRLAVFRDDPLIVPQALRLMVPASRFAVQGPDGALVFNAQGRWFVPDAAALAAYRSTLVIQPVAGFSRWTVAAAPVALEGHPY